MLIADRAGQPIERNARRGARLDQVLLEHCLERVTPLLAA
jgi:hypothetical protein